MAYESQTTDFGARVTASTRKFMEALDELRCDKLYYDETTLNMVFPNGGADPVFNGITGLELISVMNAFTAIDTFMTANYHYVTMDKLR
jgi:hypothetical protein